MKVSVIIPCYNVERYIERCLDSVRSQTYQDIETICVDDGSTDGTVYRIKAWQERTGQELQLLEQANRGASAARNAGLTKASGVYIQFLDADDALMSDKIGHQMDLAIACEMPDLIIGSAVFQNDAGHRTGTVIQPTSGRDTWMDLMQHRLGGTPQNFWKRDAVAAVHGWNEGSASSQEYELMFSMLKRGAHVIFDDRPLTEIQHRSVGSISQTNRAANWVRYVELRGRILEHLRSLNDGRDLQPFVQVLFDNIRVLYDLDPKAAMDLHARLIPSAFRPRRSPTSGSAYIGLHRLLGFHGAQRVRGWLARSSAPVTAR